MLSEKEKMQRAKFYLEQLCQGTDPVSGKPADDDTLKNERIIRCFCYIEELLENAIKDGNRTSKPSHRSKAAFYLTKEEQAALKPLPEECVVSELVAMINQSVNDANRKKLQARWINNWLVEQGYLRNAANSAGRNYRELTARSAEIGISSRTGQGAFGAYTIVVYSQQAQRFILEHLQDIIKAQQEEKNDV